MPISLIFKQSNFETFRIGFSTFIIQNGVGRFFESVANQSRFCSIFYRKLNVKVRFEGGINIARTFFEMGLANPVRFFVKNRIVNKIIDMAIRIMLLAHVIGGEYFLQH